MSGQPDEKYITLNSLRYPVTGPVLPRAQVPYPSPIVQGDAARVTNQLVGQEIVADQRGGSGANEYTESGGDTPLTMHTVSDCDTRYGVVTCRPLIVGVGTIAGAPLTGRWHLEVLATAGSAQLLAWNYDGLVYRWTGATWTNIATLGHARAFASFNGNHIVADSSGTVGLGQKSTDGVTWTTCNPAASGSYGCAVHDNKLWFVDISAANSSALIQTSDLTTYTSVASIIYRRDEIATQLVEWRGPYPGQRYLWLLTNQAAYIYDDDSTRFYRVQEFSSFAAPTGTLRPWMAVWARTDNAYVALYDAAGPGGRDTLLELTGGPVAALSPNRLGGIRVADQWRFSHCVGGSAYWLYCFGQEVYGAATAGAGCAVPMAEGGAFQGRLARDIAGSVSNGTAVVRGGGWGNGLLYTILSTGAVWVQTTPDDPALPQFAARTYDPTPTAHELAWFTGGARELDKVAFRGGLGAVYDNGTVKDAPGLPTGATVAETYQLDGAAATALASYGAGDVLPKSTRIAGGARYKRARPRLTLTRGAATTATPIVTALWWDYRRRPMQQYDYQCTVDLAWGEQQGGLAQRYGRTAAQMRAELYALANPTPPATGIVPFSYGGGVDGGGPNLVSVLDATVEIAPAEDPVTGAGELLLVVRDVSQPNSAGICAAPRPPPGHAAHPLGPHAARGAQAAQGPGQPRRAAVEAHAGHLPPALPHRAAHRMGGMVVAHRDPPAAPAPRPVQRAAQPRRRVPVPADHPGAGAEPDRPQPSRLLDPPTARLAGRRLVEGYDHQPDQRVHAPRHPQGRARAGGAGDVPLRRDLHRRAAAHAAARLPGGRGAARRRPFEQGLMVFQSMVPNPETGKLEPAPLAYPDATTAHKGLMTRAQATTVAQLGTDSGWLLPNYSPNWADFGTGRVAVGYRKDALGWVAIEGLAKKGIALALPDTIFTLPVGYRPATGRMFACASTAGYAEVRVETNGTVVLQAGGSATYTSLDGIRFDPAR